jgi:hypothetical protein
LAAPAAVPVAIPSSFRDPAGYVILENGVFKRIITNHGREDYRHFVSSGLSESLVAQGFLVRYSEEEGREFAQPEVHKVLVPEQIPFISYPYEWSFDQLRDAALLTLEVQEEALARGLSLKDASAFNVQFQGSIPVFIDLLSFERDSGGPWSAYEQFCTQFLGPLLLMRHCDPAANRFLKADLDGLPLDFVSRALPWPTIFQAGVLTHIHLHARARARYANRRPAWLDSQVRSAKPHPGLKAAILQSLRRAVEKLCAPDSSSVWSEYSDQRAHYSVAALMFKKEFVRDALYAVRPRTTCDLGANAGEYAEDAARLGSYSIALDMDSACVNRMYLRAKQAGNRRLLPLVMDLRNPSAGSGFAHQERSSLEDRAHSDLTLVLAFLHHLRITGQVPLANIARFLSRLTNYAVVEFVPKTDPMTQKLLAGRIDRFDDYTLEGFLDAFQTFFYLQRRGDIPGTERSLWLMRSKCPRSLEP